MLIQQGDVLFQLVKKIPSSVKKVSRSERGYVIAEGESTGHAHVIEDDVDLYLSNLFNDKMYMSNSNDVIIKHEEHKHINIPSGIWEIRKVREYDHFAEEARTVRD